MQYVGIIDHKFYEFLEGNVGGSGGTCPIQIQGKSHSSYSNKSSQRTPSGCDPSEEIHSDDCAYTENNPISHTNP